VPRDVAGHASQIAPKASEPPPARLLKSLGYGRSGRY
jgi:hypothetical protein